MKRNQEPNIWFEFALILFTLSNNFVRCKVSKSQGIKKLRKTNNLYTCLAFGEEPCHVDPSLPPCTAFLSAQQRQQDSLIFSRRNSLNYLKLTSAFIRNCLNNHPVTQLVKL